MHDYKLLALKLKLVTQLAVRHEKMTSTFVNQVIFCVFIFEYFIALLAFEGLFIEQRHHNTVNILETLGLFAVRALLFIS